MNQRKCVYIRTKCKCLNCISFFEPFVSLLLHAKGAGWNACTNTPSTLCHSPVFTVCCSLLRAGSGRAEGAWKCSGNRAKIPTMGWETENDHVWGRQDEADKRELSAEQCQAKVNFAKPQGQIFIFNKRILPRTVMQEFCCFKHWAAVVILPFCLHANIIELEQLKLQRSDHLFQKWSCPTVQWTHSMHMSQHFACLVPAHVRCLPASNPCFQGHDYTAHCWPGM